MDINYRKQQKVSCVADAIKKTIHALGSTLIGHVFHIWGDWHTSKIEAANLRKNIFHLSN